MAATTRLGLYGGPRGVYGTVAGKVSYQMIVKTPVTVITFNTASQVETFGSGRTKVEDI